MTDLHDDARTPDEMTVSSRITLPDLPADSESRDFTIARSTMSAPWLLQQFYAGGIDLPTELANRYPALPLMTLFKLRDGKSTPRPAVATLAAPDGAASLIIECQPGSYKAQFAFTFGSMLTLRFRLDDLHGVDCAHWLELIKRDQDGIAFLWGQSRWEKDYLICTIRRQFASIFAFSPHGLEAGVRLTHDAKRRLHDWLAATWNPDTASTGTVPNLLTW
jgi:hypothetical protein